MLHVISLSIGLAVLWMLLSGFFLPLLLGLGAASIFAIVYLCHRMDLIDHEGTPVHVTWRAFLYFPWLCLEIVKANWDVVKAILFPGKRVNPTVLRAVASQKTHLGHVIYANSITLTPGTVTIAVEDGVMTVHALTQGGADGVKSGDMDRRCAAVEGYREPEPQDDVQETAADPPAAEDAGDVPEGAKS